MRNLILVVSILMVAVALVPGTPWAAQTLDLVRANGEVRCGVSENLPGFAGKDEAGQWQGFEIDFARAVAAAALGQAHKAAFVPVTSANRFPVLLSGKIELLMRNTTMTFEREAAIGMDFAGIYFFDGQAFMVRRGGGLHQIADLNGATICLGKRTTHEVNLADYFQQRGWTYTPLAADTMAEMESWFYGGRCQGLTSDRATLAAMRMTAPGGPQEYEILPGLISKEPLGPVVQRGDEQWLILVRWVLFALIEAEERGVTQANVRELFDHSQDPKTRRFLASDGLGEKALGISPGWVVRVIEAVGNYGEIYERYLGSRSRLNLDRGHNRLWTKGGLLYAPPLR